MADDPRNRAKSPHLNRRKVCRCVKPKGPDKDQSTTPPPLLLDTKATTTIRISNGTIRPAPLLDGASIGDRRCQRRRCRQYQLTHFSLDLDRLEKPARCAGREEKTGLLQHLGHAAAAAVA